MGLRDPNKDKPKSTAQYLKETRVNSTCMLEDCNNPISTFEGPGSQVLCRAHQIECVEYGGMGKPDRPHTFYRNWVCDNCGYDPREDDLRFGHVENEYDKLRAMRGVMHGDHIHLKSQGGSNAKENIRSLCVLCHMAKSYIEKDYLGNKKL
tara:strand:+ start:4576 stop:5028 length:453 start_codon:yes stop_codon:yes gene_type:complete